MVRSKKIRKRFKTNRECFHQFKFAGFSTTKALKCVFGTTIQVPVKLERSNHWSDLQRLHGSKPQASMIIDNVPLLLLFCKPFIKNYREIMKSKANWATQQGVHGDSAFERTTTKISQVEFVLIRKFCYKWCKVCDYSWYTITTGKFDHVCWSQLTCRYIYIIQAQAKKFLKNKKSPERRKICFTDCSKASFGFREIV